MKFKLGDHVQIVKIFDGIFINRYLKFVRKKGKIVEVFEEDPPYIYRVAIDGDPLEEFDYWSDEELKLLDESFYVYEEL